MDTNRITIITNDLSPGVVTTLDTLQGYTVVRAACGPIEPLYIAANSSATIYEAIGYTSADNPAVQELLDFNSSYAVYVSAPYDVAAANTVPVAYITPAGTFAAAAPVSITGFRIEDVVNDEATIEGINTFSTNPSILVPVGKEYSLFGEGTADVSAALGYSGGQLQINFACDLNPTSGVLASRSNTDLHVVSSATLVDDTAQVMKSPTSVANAVGVLVIDIPDEDLLELPLVLSGSDLYLADSAGAIICEFEYSDGVTLSTLNVSGLADTSTLTTLAAKYFSTTAIASKWATSSFRSTVRVYWKAQLATNAIHGVMYPKYLSEGTTTISFTKLALGNKINLTVSKLVTPSSYSSSTVYGSLLESDTDGFNASMDFASLLDDNYLLNVITIKPFEDSTIYTATKTSVAPTLTQSSVVLSRGARYVTDECMELGWEEALDPELDPVEVFFASETPAEDSVFFEIATTQRLARMVMSTDIAPTYAVEDMTALSYGSAYVVTCNKFLRKSTFTKETYWSPAVGAYAAKILRGIEYKLGGAAPMYLDGADEVGGQLSITVQRPQYKYSKDQLSYLNDANYNPIIRDSHYGVMVVGQKTCKSGDTGDWSYVGHMSAFLKIIRDIRDGVMIPQLGKPNNPYYRELRAQQVDTLLKLRTSGLGRIWAAATVSTSTDDVNTTAVLASRSFAIAVKVKVDIFSEGVTLTLTNVDQFTSLGLE
jgi:hypothetical protein